MRKVSLDKINRALEPTGNTNVLGTNSTSTEAKAQVLIGTSVTGGLLLNADSASGRDFHIGD